MVVGDVLKTPTDVWSSRITPTLVLRHYEVKILILILLSQNVLMLNMLRIANI